MASFEAGSNEKHLSVRALTGDCLGPLFTFNESEVILNRVGAHGAGGQFKVKCGF